MARQGGKGEKNNIIPLAHWFVLTDPSAVECRETDWRSVLSLLSHMWEITSKETDTFCHFCCLLCFCFQGCTAWASIILQGWLFPNHYDLGAGYIILKKSGAISWPKNPEEFFGISKGELTCSAIIAALPTLPYPPFTSSATFHNGLFILTERYKYEI